MLDFQDFLFQKVPLVGTLSKTRVLISRTYVAKQKVPLVTTLSKTRVLISRTYVAKQGMNHLKFVGRTPFLLGKNTLKNTKFLSFLTSNITFGLYLV